MIEYTKVNAKLSNLQWNKLKSAAKNPTGVTLRMNIKMLNGNNWPHESLLTIRQKTKLRNPHENILSTDIKLSKAQISKIIQSGRFLGSLLSKLAGPLMKLAVPLVKNILAPLGIRVATSAIDAKIQNKMHGSGTTEEMNDITKIVQALEDSDILLKGVTKTIKNETKEKKRIFRNVIRCFRC